MPILYPQGGGDGADSSPNLWLLKKYCKCERNFLNNNCKFPAYCIIYDQIKKMGKHI